MKNANLWRALGRNFCISIVLFGAFLGLLWLVELLFPAMKGQLLHFDNTAWIVGIPASIVGVAYILTVRDPQNFTGFFAGIVMSALLGVQFTLQGNYDSTFLYFFGLDYPALAAVIDIDADKEIVFGNELTIDDIVWTGIQPSLRDKCEPAGRTPTQARA